MKVSQTTNFTVHVNQSICSFSIQPAEAIYTFLSTGNKCDGNKPFGFYKAGKPLMQDDSVVVQVDVATPGLYSFQTSIINGISFSASGVFTSKGVQDVSMTGEGTPLTGGNFVFPINAPSSACIFFIKTDYKIADPSMYYSFDAEGRHYSGYLDSALLGRIVTPTGTVNILSFGTIATVSADSIITITLSRIDSGIRTGTYHSAIISNEDYAGGMDFSYNSAIIYFASNDLPTYQTELNNYSTSGMLVKGKFYGPAKNNKGQIVTIENGIFETYLAH